METSLMEMHAMLAAAFHPCMALEQDEAKALSKCLAEVQRHYPHVRLLSDKHAAVVGLVLCGSRIYGKRAMILAGVDIPTGPKARPKATREAGSSVIRPEKFNPEPPPAQPAEPDPIADLMEQGIAPTVEPWGGLQ